MTRRKQPSLTPEERDRNRREADERMRALCDQRARELNPVAQAWLVQAGAMVPGEGVRDRLVRLDRYRRSLVQASAPAYRPTARQQLARPCPGVDVEIDF